MGFFPRARGHFIHGSERVRIYPFYWIRFGASFTTQCGYRIEQG